MWCIPDGNKGDAGREKSKYHKSASVPAAALGTWPTSPVAVHLGTLCGNWRVEGIALECSYALDICKFLNMLCQQSE